MGFLIYSIIVTFYVNTDNIISSTYEISLPALTGILRCSNFFINAASKKTFEKDLCSKIFHEALVNVIVHCV